LKKNYALSTNLRALHTVLLYTLHQRLENRNDALKRKIIWSVMVYCVHTMILNRP